MGLIEHVSFTQLKEVVDRYGWNGQVDGILLDLGVSSPQLDDPTRGFSFTREGPLDMRMNQQQGMDAATWLNQAAESDIIQVLREYGEERFARRIAAAIVAERKQQKITTTTQLCELIEKVVPNREIKKHPATRSFQGIRIFINRELEELKECLEQCLQVMSVSGRICAISFHSLEDRLVKRFIQRGTQGDEYPPELPIRDAELNRRLRKVSQLIRPSEQETQQNPRARSARLRVAEKIA